MNIRFFIICSFLLTLSVSAQKKERDTLYIKEYPQDFWLRLYAPTKFLSVDQSNNTYNPTFPVAMGVGAGLRKQLGINILASYNLFHSRNSKNSPIKSDITDFQIHRYGQYFLIDAYYQDYSGFYHTKKPYEENQYPQLGIRQIGIESSYVWRGDKFSARAAFEQSERQLKSAGSFIFGNAFYWHHIEPDPQQIDTDLASFENLQLGSSIGYAQSWVLGRGWLVSVMFSGGLNFGNQLEVLKKGKIKLYPSSLGRFSLNYHWGDWSIAALSVFSNKSVYPKEGKPYRLVSPNVQLSITRYLYL